MSEQKRLQWRQGDVLIERHDGAIVGPVREGDVLYTGEATGHSHRVTGASVRIHETSWSLFLDASADATITHEEHGPIVLPPGRYRVWRQREYSEAGWRTLKD